MLNIIKFIVSKFSGKNTPKISDEDRKREEQIHSDICKVHYGPAIYCGTVNKRNVESYKIHYVADVSYGNVNKGGSETGTYNTGMDDHVN